MKKIFSFSKLAVIAVVLFSALSCENFMSTESDRYLRNDEYKLNSVNDTVFSAIGILNKMQKLAVRNVLIGELRADLMDITPNTARDERALSDLNIDPANNVYSNPKDFYAVINNCNVFLQRADTALKFRNDPVFKLEINAVKTIRIWTYLQIGLNYGKAVYYKTPILSVEDISKNYPELTTKQLVDSLVKEMESLDPVHNYEVPNYGTEINKSTSTNLFLNPLILAGDLYLWKASFADNDGDKAINFESALNMYARLIEKGTLTDKYNNYSSSTNYVMWGNDTFKPGSGTMSRMSTREQISIMNLTSSTYDGTFNTIPQMSKKWEIKSSVPYHALSDAQIYAYKKDATSPVKYTTGDLRITSATSNYYIDAQATKPIEIIYKFSDNTFPVYRVGLLYLRYAEALNRIGKPNMAFAVLKYGLNSASLDNPKWIPASETSDNKSYFTIFKTSAFDNATDELIGSKTLGIHSRGSGLSNVNDQYKIPNFTGSATARMDTINFVEDAICDELALETAFEGNRFHDLMRISNHKNDPSFLAKKVAEKHPQNKAAFITLLSDKANWYLPMKK